MFELGVTEGPRLNLI